jgi:arylsulfatase A-like enzyme
MRARTLYSIGAIAVATLLVPACSGGGDEVEWPNVVVVTLDTVRADHIGCYGYERSTSPRIDALAASATRFTRAIATSSWTVPSHASLFTGRFPFEHGAHAFEVEEGTINNVNPLPADEVTLAELLWDRGYMTGAFVANEAFLSPRWQLNQGFEIYDVERAYAPEVNRKVFRWLEVAKTKPFFLFVNYIDAHRPYNTYPRPGVTRRGAVRDGGALLDSLYKAVMPGTGEVPAEIAGRVIDQYDTAVANVDDAVGELIQRLERLGVYNRTIVVITSDHGEYFGEHHLVEHSKDIYQEGLMVPLVVKAPDQTQSAVDERLIDSTDIPRLILDHFPEGFEDVRSRFPAAPGDHDVIAEIYYTRTKDLHHPRWGHRFNRIRTAYFDWPWKLISSSDGAHELYDLSHDPYESDNRYETAPEVAQRLTTSLHEFFAGRMRSNARVDQTPLSEEELERLRSLGYVGN